MGAIATFNYSTFADTYPEFGAVDEQLITLYFQQAELFHANDGTGPVVRIESQTMLLNMVTAHIAQLMTPKPGAENEVGSPQLVGPIQSASEGSVSVSVANNFPPGSAQWWQQTKYGAMYWAAMAVYRTMHYRVNRGRPMNPFYPFRYN